MESLTRISVKTPKTKRPKEIYEYSLLTSLRKTPYKLSKTKNFTIGRKSRNDITLQQFTTSDLHATVKWVKSGFKVIDEKSTNGTYLNGKRINSPAFLKDGDKIKIGKYVLKFTVRKVRIKKES